jgi:O-glycosyl hydrolase
LKNPDLLKLNPSIMKKMAAVRLIFIPLLLSVLVLSCRKTEERPSAALVTQTWSSESGFYMLDRQQDLEFAAVDSDFSKPTINVNQGIQYQSFLGFGESFDGSTLYNLARMNPAKRTELLEKLIDPNKGAGFNLFRICIGTSDFTPESWGWYSFDDIPAGQTDTELSSFSIQKDIDNHIISVLKEAFQIASKKGVSLRLVATPWSPPGWMKTKIPYSMAGGELKSQYNEVYAHYLFKFLEAYKNEGIPVYAITVQNEPGWVTSTPSTAMTASQESAVILALRAYIDGNSEIETKILAYDWNFHDMSHPNEVLTDPEVKDAIFGVAFHGYDWVIHDEKNLSDLHELYPDVPLLHTESAFWNTDGMDMIIKLFRNWISSYLGWVTLLDTDNTGGSGNEDEMFPGTPTPPYFLLEASDKDTNVVNYSIAPTYYLKQQFSKFIRLNARRVYSDAGISGLSNVAFLNTDGTLALVVVNQNDDAREFKVISQRKQFLAEIPGKTVATYEWKGTNAQLSPNVNLAQGKPVTASSSEGGNYVSFAADGKFRTRWASNWNDNEWIRVDLGSIVDINRIVLDWEDAFGMEYLVQVSDDAINWKTIYHEMFGFPGEHAYYAGTSGRYVKMAGIHRGTSWGYSLFEFGVY